MDLSSMPSSIGAALQEARALRANGASVEGVFGMVRRRCLSKVHSIRVLMEVERLTLAEASE